MIRWELVDSDYDNECWSFGRKVLFLDLFNKLSPNLQKNIAKRLPPTYKKIKPSKRLRIRQDLSGSPYTLIDTESPEALAHIIDFICRHQEVQMDFDVDSYDWVIDEEALAEKSVEQVLSFLFRDN